MDGQTNTHEQKEFTILAHIPQESNREKDIQDFISQVTSFMAGDAVWKHLIILIGFSINYHNNGRVGPTERRVHRAQYRSERYLSFWLQQRPRWVFYNPISKSLTEAWTHYPCRRPANLALQSDSDGHHARHMVICAVTGSWQVTSRLKPERVTAPLRCTSLHTAPARGLQPSCTWVKAPVTW